MQRDRSGVDAAHVSLSASAVQRRVAVEQLAPVAAARYADLIVVPRDLGQVQHDHELFGVL